MTGVKLGVIRSNRLIVPVIKNQLTRICLHVSTLLLKILLFSNERLGYSLVGWCVIPGLLDFDIIDLFSTLNFLKDLLGVLVDIGSIGRERYLTCCECFFG